MKRALATFGNPFGLALYDRERRGVAGRKVVGVAHSDIVNIRNANPPPYRDLLRSIRLNIL